MKIQIQAGMFLVIGKTSELNKMKEVCAMMALDLDDDMSVDNASDDNNAILECGYKSDYYTIKEIKELFQFCKAKVK